MLIKKLQDIGLSEKEAKVYIATLELGKGSASEIAMKAGINRATTYFTVESLIKKGLISASSQKSKQVFVPEDPGKIESILEQKQRELEKQKKEVKDLVAKLNRISNPTEKPVIKYYLGKKNIIRMASNSFAEVEKETMWVAFSKDRLKLFLSEKENKRLQEKRETQKIKAMVLYNSSSGDSLKNDKNNLRIRVSEKKYPFPGDVAVYKDKIRLTSYEDEIGIIIENKNIAETLKSLFKIAINCMKKTPESE